MKTQRNMKNEDEIRGGSREIDRMLTAGKQRVDPTKHGDDRWTSDFERSKWRSKETCRPLTETAKAKSSLKVFGREWWILNGKRE